MARILERKIQDQKEDMVKAIDTTRNTGFRQNVLGLQQKMEDMKIELKTEKENAEKEARNLETMKDTRKKETEEYRKRLLLASEEDGESEEEGNDYNQSAGYMRVPATIGGYRPGILKMGGATVVPDNYKKNLEMRKFTEEAAWWQSVIDLFAKGPVTGLRAIPPGVKSTAFQVENPKEGLIKAFKENINGSRDHFYNIFETAKMMIGQDICRHLPQIYTDHLIPLNERNLL